MGNGPEYWKCSTFDCAGHRLTSTGRPAPRREEEHQWCSPGSPPGDRFQSKACPGCPEAAGKGQRRDRGDVWVARGGGEEVEMEWVGLSGGLTGRGLDWL